MLNKLSSNYYLNQMDFYNKKIKELKIEKNNHEELNSKLSQLLESLPDIKSDLIASEKLFSDGGYIDDDGTFDKGKLKESYDILENVINSINSVIGETSSTIFSLEKEIINYVSV